MKRNAFDSSLRSTYSFLQRCGLCRGITSLHSINASEEFRELALSDGTRYLDLFLCGLRNHDYNFLLQDYSYFQFTFIDTGNYRYAFYPTPLGGLSPSNILELDSALRAGIISFEEYSQLLDDEEYEIRIPVIRFELDREAYVRLRHPTAHFHIGTHSENRWPVARSLTPLLFALFIIKLYFGHAWSSNGDTPETANGYNNVFDNELTSEKVCCFLLGSESFHETERGHLHLS